MLKKFLKIILISLISILILSIVSFYIFFNPYKNKDEALEDYINSAFIQSSYAYNMYLLSLDQADIFANFEDNIENGVYDLENFTFEEELYMSQLEDQIKPIIDKHSKLKSNFLKNNCLIQIDAVRSNKRACIKTTNNLINAEIAGSLTEEEIDNLSQDEKDRVLNYKDETEDFITKNTELLEKSGEVLVKNEIYKKLVQIRYALNEEDFNLIHEKTLAELKLHYPEIDEFLED